MGQYSFDSQLFGKLFKCQSDNYARLSVKMDVDWRTIQRWTEGSDIHATNLAKVCNLFHVSPLSFFPCEGEQEEMVRQSKGQMRMVHPAVTDVVGEPKHTDIEAYREARRDLSEEYQQRIERMEEKMEELREKLMEERMKSKELEVRLEIANQQLLEQKDVKPYMPQTPVCSVVSESR